MSLQIFSRIFRSSVSRNIYPGVRAKNVDILHGNKQNILLKPAHNVRHKSSNGDGIFASDNVLMFTGLGLLGGVMFYVCNFLDLYILYLLVIYWINSHVIILIIIIQVWLHCCSSTVHPPPLPLKRCLEFGCLPYHACVIGLDVTACGEMTHFPMLTTIRRQ